MATSIPVTMTIDGVEYTGVLTPTASDVEWPPLPTDDPDWVPVP